MVFKVSFLIIILCLFKLSQQEINDGELTNDERFLLLETIEFGYDINNIDPQIAKEKIIEDADELQEEIKEVSIIAENMVEMAEVMFSTFFGGNETQEFMENIKEVIEEVREQEDEYIQELKKGKIIPKQQTLSNDEIQTDSKEQQLQDSTNQNIQNTLNSDPNNEKQNIITNQNNQINQQYVQASFLEKYTSDYKIKYELTFISVFLIFIIISGLFFSKISKKVNDENINYQYLDNDLNQSSNQIEELEIVNNENNYNQNIY